MKSIKRIGLLLMTGMLLASCFGCGGNAPAPSGSPAPSGAPATGAPAPATGTPAP